MLKILFNFVENQSNLKRRSSVLSLPDQLVFPGQGTEQGWSTLVICIAGMKQVKKSVFRSNAHM
jgi:hypothetical protein